MEKPTVRIGRYRHYKGKELYRHWSRKAQRNPEELVVYRPEYGERGLWVRPREMFLEEVEVHGVRVPRFEFISE